MKKNNFPTEVLDVTIQHIDAKGLGVAYHRHELVRGSEGKKLTLFIPNVVPGDKVRVTVPNAKGRRKAGMPFDELLEPSPKRNLSVSLTQDKIGGTPLKYMKYEAQLEHKMEVIKDNLASANFDSSLVKPIIGMEEPNRYRNKMEFTFGSNGELGMHEQGNYRNIIDLKDSILAPEEMIEVKHEISRWQKDHQLAGYNKDTHEGLLRKLMVRKSFVTEELMVVLMATKSPNAVEQTVSNLIDRLADKFHHLKSLLWIEDANISEQTTVEDLHLLYGREYINDELNGFQYQIKHNTFFQVNPAQAEKMVQHALKIAEVQSDMHVVDLFCGIGTFSLPFAEKSKQLIGIELVKNSILSAKTNAKKAGLKNTHFFASDARKGLEQLKETEQVPDLLILNPPRSGAGGKLMRSIGRFGSDKVLYISCNPKTLAQDLIWLNDYGYQLKNAQPIDQFPHTVHVETVVLMEKDKVDEITEN